MTQRRELTEAEAARYNRCFAKANKLLEPFLRGPESEYSKAERQALEKAITLYDKALSIYPASWQSLWLRGKAYQASGDVEQAYSSFRQAYSLCSGNPDVVNEYLIEAINLNRTEEAFQAGKLAAAQFPEHTGLQANYALILVLVNDPEQAISQGRLALKLAPDDPITIRLIHIAKEIREGKRTCPKTVRELMLL